MGRTRRRWSLFVATYLPFFFRSAGRPSTKTVLAEIPNSLDAPALSVTVFVMECAEFVRYAKIYFVSLLL